MKTNLLGLLFKAKPGIPQSKQSQRSQQPKPVFPRVGEQPKADTQARGFFAVLKDVATQFFSKQKTPNVSSKLPKPVAVSPQYLPETAPAIVTKTKAPAEQTASPDKPAPQKPKQTEQVTETLIPLQMVLQQAVPLQPKVFAAAATPKQTAPKTEARAMTAEKPVLQIPVVDRSSTRIPIAQKPLSQKPVIEHPSPQATIAEKPTLRMPVVESPVVRAPKVPASSTAKVKQSKLPVGMPAVREEKVQVEAKGIPQSAARVETVISVPQVKPQSVTADAGGIAPKQEVKNLGVTVPKQAPRDFGAVLPKQETKDIRGIAATQESKPISQNPTINVVREIQGFWQKHLKADKPVQPPSPVLSSHRGESGTEEVANVKGSERVKPTQPVIQTVQAERLGGTELKTKAPTKESRVDRENDVPVSTPKSFWGVKVVSEPQAKPMHEPQLKQAEDLPKVAVQPEKPADKAEQPAVKKAPVTAMPVADAVRKKEEPLATAEPKPAAHVEPKTVTPQAVKPAEEQAQKFETAAEKEKLPLPKMAVAEPAAVSNGKTVETPQSTTVETPVAPQALAATAQEQPAVMTQTPAMPRAVFTLEQIKELQAIVAKSLQGARVTVDGAKEAVFNWNHDVLGPLAFRISARKDDVEIQIQSNRRDVAEALEEGRGTVERMIADIGLKVERFEVKLRSEAWNQDLANQTHERDQSRHGKQAEGDVATGAGGNLDLETEEESAPAAAPAPARGWVA